MTRRQDLAGWSVTGGRGARGRETGYRADGSPDWSRPRCEPDNGPVRVLARLAGVAVAMVAAGVVASGTLLGGVWLAGHAPARVAGAVLGLVVVLAGFTVARRSWRPGFNEWLDAVPHHRRGSCQWLIARGELSGTPCQLCMALMGRGERRYWTARTTGTSTGATTTGRLPGRLGVLVRARDAGAARIGALGLPLLSGGCLVLGFFNRASDDAQTRATALPLALACMLTAGIGLTRGRSRTSTDQDSDGAAVEASVTALGSAGAVCESCRTAPGTVRVVFTDGAVFMVCPSCARGAYGHVGGVA